MSLRKRCNRCEKRRAVSCFFKDRKRRDGLQGHCRDCHREYMHYYYRQRDKKRRHNELSAMREKGIYISKMPPALAKKCTCCAMKKPLEAYGVSVWAKDGHASQCKPCLRDYMRRYNQVNPRNYRK